MIIFCFSCTDDCDDSDCPPNRVWFLFEPVDSMNQNLFSRPDSIYNDDSISLVHSNTPLNFSVSSKHLVISAPNSLSEFVVDFSYGRTDTFYTTINYSADECCGEVVNDYSLSSKDSILCNPCYGDPIKIQISGIGNED